ncbi:MAG: hypothetical protein HYV36_07360 [Lentisphaerae bacterium]|nr:hypothetical protein [Lentisphaerota bacterium]
MRAKPLKIALIYNASTLGQPEEPGDTSGLTELRHMIGRMAQALRQLKYRLTILPLAQNLSAFQKRLRRLRPDVVFNQYEDVVPGTVDEMRVAALVELLGYPLTGSPALALGLTCFKYTTASLLHSLGIAIPSPTELLEHSRDVGRRRWQFPLIVQPSHEHAGIGLERDSVVYSVKALRRKVRKILKAYAQPALARQFLSGREFNVSLLGGRKLRVLPIAEVNYKELPAHIPPILSYAANWLENTVEYKKISISCPARVKPELACELRQTALRVFRAVGGWGYGRVDFRLDAAGRPRVIDVNCNPLLEEDQALACSAEAGGIPYPQLLQAIVEAALECQPYDSRRL